MKINYPKARLVNNEGELVIQEKELANETGDIVRRNRGDFAGYAFFLKDDYDWIIVKDNHSNLCLVPLKKTGD